MPPRLSKSSLVSSESLPPPVLLVGGTMSLALLGDSLLYVALPAHASELALPLWGVGVLLGANRLFRLITNGLAAGAFQRLGGRVPMIAAGICSVLTTAMYGVTPTFLPMLLARLIWGACFSVLRLGAFTVVLAASRPATRGRLIGVYQSISRLGPVVSLLVGGLLVDAIGFRLTFIVLAVATAPSIVLALLLPAAAYRSHTSYEDAPPAPLRRSSLRERWFGGRELLAVKLGMLANGFTSHGVVLSTVTLALTAVAGTAEGAAAIGGLLVAFRWSTDLFLAPSFGHLSDRLGRWRTIPVLLVLEAIAVGGLALASDRTTVVLAALGVFLMSTAMTAVSDAAAGDLAPPERRAEVMSGYSDWIDIGAALGPPLAFMLADRLGLWPSYTLNAALLFVVAIWFMFAFCGRMGAVGGGHAVT